VSELSLFLPSFFVIGQMITSSRLQVDVRVLKIRTTSIEKGDSTQSQSKAKIL